MISIILIITVCGVLSWGYAYVFAFAAIMIGAPIVEQRKITFNFLLHPEFWILGLFGLSYVLFDELNAQNLTYYFALPLMAYMVGWSSQDGRKDGCEQAKNALLAITLGFCLYAALNYFANLGHNRYQLIDFWSGQFRAATGSGFLNTLILSIILYSMLLEKRRLIQTMLIIGTIISTLYMFMLGTRTQMFICGIVLVLMLLVYMNEKHTQLWGLRTLGVLAAIAAALLLLYFLNFLGVRDTVDNSNLMARYQEGMGIHHSNSERIEQFFAGLSSLVKYPFGGQRETLYYHNMWLDIGRISGIVPLCFSLLYSIRTFLNMWKIFRDKNNDTGLRYLLISVYTGVVFNFFVEPVMEGMLNFFLAFCAINGIADCYLYRRQNENSAEKPAPRAMIITRQKNWMTHYE